MSVDSYRLRQGGLMRCCIGTLDEMMETAEVEPPIGTVVPCNNCSSGVRRAADGTWEWDHD